MVAAVIAYNVAKVAIAIGVAYYVNTHQLSIYSKRY